VESGRPTCPLPIDVGDPRSGAMASAAESARRPRRQRTPRSASPARFLAVEREQGAAMRSHAPPGTRCTRKSDSSIPRRSERDATGVGDCPVYRPNRAPRRPPPRRSHPREGSSARRRRSSLIGRVRSQCREAVGISLRSDEFLYNDDKESILRWSFRFQKLRFGRLSRSCEVAPERSCHFRTTARNCPTASRQGDRARQAGPRIKAIAPTWLGGRSRWPDLSTPSAGGWAAGVHGGCRTKQGRYTKRTTAIFGDLVRASLPGWATVSRPR